MKVKLESYTFHLEKIFKFPIAISHSLNNKTESYLLPNPMEEVKVASLELLNEPDLEEEAPFFIEEEAEPSKPEPLDEFAETPRPPIELQPLPPGLAYAFLNNNLEFPIIISDKLTQEQTLRLMAVLEKTSLSLWLLTPRSYRNQSYDLYSSYFDRSFCFTFSRAST